MIIQQEAERIRSHHGLEHHGFTRPERVWWNLTTPILYEHAVKNQEALIAHKGPLVAFTGKHTGRSAKDKFIVRDAVTENDVWWGNVNIPFDQDKFDSLHRRMVDYLQKRNLYVQDCYAGADPAYRMPVRVITEMAWHSLFARTMFRLPSREELFEHVPEFTVIDAPGFHADPARDGTNSGTFIIISFAQRLVLIGGTEYAGEIKKSIFTVMNYQLPQRRVLSMHCSANYGLSPNDAALFFGLSGTGKTTLSSDPDRMLVGDDEHGWSDDGIFNIEGGCYAKVIRLSQEGEPEIYAQTRKFGTVLENVVTDPNTGRIDLDDPRFTENTRAAYPLSNVSNADLSGMCGHPRNVIFLTADAFGVMPPVARLTLEQAMYHFISGYTAKVAGTEQGMGDEPTATFSACFGAPFLPLHPATYADLLRAKLERYGSDVWLVNTGWTSGAFGTGHRMPLEHTRAIISAILDGTLSEIETREDPIFGLHVPVHVPDVPPELLDPRSTWDDPDSYDRMARELAEKFKQNFLNYADEAGEAVANAGPKV